MSTEHPEAGTGDPPVETVEETAIDAGEGSLGSGDEGQGKKVTIDQQEYIALKVARENQKNIEAENERLKAGQETRTTTDTRGSEADEARTDLERAQQKLASDKAYLSRIEDAAKSGNEEARAALAVVRTAVEASERSIAAEERTVYRLEMMDVPAEKRDAVRAAMAKTPGMRSPALMYRFMKGDEHETQAQEIVRLKKELEDAKTPRPAVDRQIRGASKAAAVAPGVKVITLADYNERMAADPHTTIAERKAGKFKIEG